MNFDNLVGLELRSEVTSGGRLHLSLPAIAVRPPEPGEVIVRIDAAPINPSDLGLLLAAADMTTAKVDGTGAAATVEAIVPAERLASFAARFDQLMPVGNEGAGVVIRAGSDVQSLMGKTVAIQGGTYAQYRTISAGACLPLPDGVTAADGASAFINPLTALGMVETMRREGHRALVHTAAASNLGQMLTRLCLKDGIDLVNIVRNAEQAKILRSIGAQHVCDSSASTFGKDLEGAISATGATLAFDAIGGGNLVSQILAAMEATLTRTATTYSRYGSQTHKQVYVYGGLDLRPTTVDRNIGMAWGVGGWLVTWFLEKIGPAAAQLLRERVASELTTTFHSRYTAQISLVEALQLDTLAAYARRATGEKYLITPNKPAA